MNKLILLSCLVFLSFSAVAEPQPAFKSALASKRLLTDIVKVGNAMVAVGERGHIIHSIDGKSWTQADVPVNVLLTDVFFLDEKLGWAIGHDVTVLVTKDGGKSWTIQHHAPKMDKPLFSVHFKDKNNGIVIGAYGLFMRTSDGGVSWQQEFHGEFLHADDLDYLNDLKAKEPAAYQDETSSILPHFNRLLIEGEKAYLAGESGLVATSDDYGVTWQKIDAFYNGSFFDLAKVEGKGLFIAGLRGNIFNSTADITQWQRVEVDAKTSINRILSSGDSIVLVGNSGLLFTSHDGGKTFKSFSLSDGKAVTSGIFVGGTLILSSEVGIKQLAAGQW
jgi:photosystem II stability/assembly factor-like uncharacterized protein